MSTMNKTLIIHHINDIDNIPAMERWFVHHHCPEVMACLLYTSDAADE